MTGLTRQAIRVMHGASSRSTFLLDHAGFRRFSMSGDTVEDSLATRVGLLLRAIS